MNKKRILVLGSTGKLGCMLLNYCKKNYIPIYATTCFSNDRLIKNQKKNFDITHTYNLSNTNDKSNFIDLIKNNIFKVIYFLDYGSESLFYIDILLKVNSNSIFAIANKELLIAGGKILINRIYSSSNLLIPLDSEHFSLLNSNNNNKEIDKIYISASGGPFYFKKALNLKKVSYKEVINHPKWNMGVNNSIDSSNFINKLLEIFELSSIFSIDIEKIDFLVSKEAYVHSVLVYKDNTISINCFDNDMLITLIKPLTFVYKCSNLSLKNNKFLDKNNLKLELFNDKRFKIYKFFKKLKNIDHKYQIKFMILNNIAQKKYIDGSIKYDDIVDYINKRLFDDFSLKSPKNIKGILSTIDKIRNYYA